MGCGVTLVRTSADRSPNLHQQREKTDARFRSVTRPPLPFVMSSGVTHERDDRHDGKLLEGLASGRREALAELYDRHSASLFRHALALTRRKAEAEDLVQGVFVKLASAGAQLLGVRAPASYLHRVLRNTWMDSQRETTGPIGVQSTSINDSIDLIRALDALPPLQREVIVLHVVEGLSFAEVGRVTNVSLFTAAARYRLALGRLRRTLTQVEKDKP
jgi:RNA polymerase sigma-70 factor (ECF subfamily)